MRRLGHAAWCLAHVRVDSRLTSIGGEQMTLTRLSASLADTLRPGCRLITVNKRLAEAKGFQLQEVFEGPNPDSVSAPALAYLWRFSP